MHDGSDVKLELKAADGDIATDGIARFDDNGMRGRNTGNPPEHVGLIGHVNSPDAANPSCTSAKANAKAN